ncbi:MAG TPA: pyruvate kinase [Rickettsiales bacterium]|nr:pyruvate kinase [Rickettsiales bacterium]
MKRTKIVATIGPKSEDPKILKKLSEAGVNVFRLNFSHGDHAEHGARIDNIRKLNLPGAIMLDTKGPEIRTGEVKNEFEIKTGDKITLTIDKGVYDETKKLSVNYPEFIKDVEEGAILLFDSVLQIKIDKIKGHDIFCTVAKGKGKIASKRHINLMGRHVSLPTLTKSDWEDIDFGIEKKVDFVALSFCRNAKDIEELRTYCKKKGHIPSIVAKIENPKAVENLEEIVETADAVMVARGDLADEFPFARVPQVQRMIIELCNMYAKPVIVATQMLLSMVTNTKPTRAEISDVANAVYQGADATMTSEETAKSVDPVNTIETMSEIINAAEEELTYDNSMYTKEDFDNNDYINQQLAISSIKLLQSVVGVDSIVILTKSGRMAEIISNERPEYPIFAITDDQLTSKKLNLSYSVFSMVIKFNPKDYEATIKEALKAVKSFKDYKAKKCLLISYNMIDGKEYPLVSVIDIK